MKSLRLTALATAVAVAMSPAGVAQTPSAAPPPSTQAPAAAAPSAQFKQEELDQMLAPIALYPDALVTQMLMASTYPLAIVEAARWREQNPKLEGTQLEDALKGQSWDESVKSLTAFPDVLQKMNKDLPWTQKLGDAFLGQQAQVLDTIQQLRAKAKSAGNLESNDKQKVEVQTQENKQVIVIEPANPQVVYVPTYQPTVVYGAWPYPAYPPYYPPYWAPVGGAFVRGVFWGAGIAAGAALWGGANWGRGDVNVNVNRYNNFNRTNIQNNNWQHNSANRQGVAYRDNGSRQKYGQQDARAAQSRDQFRGRESGSPDRSASAANRGAGGDFQSRDAGNRAAQGQRGGAQAQSASRGGGSFDVGRGADARSASSRGHSSLGASGGGGATRGGGGGGGRAGGGGGRRR